MPLGVRFAPSPTGRFHVGNLRTAWISFVLARELGEPWVVRFEDIDGPRVLAGAREQQLEDLFKLGLRPDQQSLQSERHHRHFELFQRARFEGRVYPCFCSRKDVQDALAGMASAPHAVTAIYSGQCRNSQAVPADFSNASIAWRLKLAEERGALDPIIARSKPIKTWGDPVLPHDFEPAYNWACAIDDGDGNYSWIVRASDLASVLGLQREIQRQLSLSTPKVFHTALVTQNDGHRLEKRTAGVTLDELSARGVSSTELLALFKKSFHLDSEKLQCLDCVAEEHSQITLRELGL